MYKDLNAADHSVLGRLIQFFKNNRLTEELSKAVSKAVHDPDFQLAYMTLQDLLDDYKEEYKEEGRFELLQRLYLSASERAKARKRLLYGLKKPWA